MAETATLLQPQQDRSGEIPSNLNKDNKELLPPMKRPRKKTKTARDEGDSKVVKGRSSRGNKGKLSALLGISMDILFEVFGHLLPLDLLHLSWSSKEFRHVIMRRSARTVWIQAFKHVEGLPECPEGMTEPQWAALVFYPFCTYCGAQNCQAVVWTCRVRCCNKCLSKRFIKEGANLIKCYAWKNELLAAVPRYWIESQEKYVYLRSQVEVHMQWIRDIPPGSDPSQHQERALRIRAYLQEESNKIIALQDHAQLCERWYISKREKRAKRQEVIRWSRVTAILVKLRDVGLDPEVKALVEWDPDSFFDHRLVKQYKALTERIWENIKDPLTEFLREKEVERLEKERVDVLLGRDSLIMDLYNGWLDYESPIEAFPSAADICLMKEFNDIVLRPADSSVTEDDFDGAMVALPRLVEEWRMDKKFRVLGLLPALPDQDPDSKDTEKDLRRLPLATTIFRCSHCIQYVHFPQILSHRCMTRLDNKQYDRNEDGSDPVLQDETSKRLRSLKCQPWGYGEIHIRYHSATSEMIKSLVVACGLDPETTTKGEMDDFNARFACLLCPHEGDRYTVMSWNIAVSHRSMHASCENFPGFKRLAPRDTQRAIRRERTTVWEPDSYEWMAEKPGCHPQHWRCTICKEGGPFIKSVQSVVDHMADHGINMYANMRQYLYHCPDANEYEWPYSLSKKMPFKMKVKDTCFCLSSECTECSEGHAKVCRE